MAGSPRASIAASFALPVKNASYNFLRSIKNCSFSFLPTKLPAFHPEICRRFSPTNSSFETPQCVDLLRFKPEHFVGCEFARGFNRVTADPVFRSMLQGEWKGL